MSQCRQYAAARLRYAQAKPPIRGSACINSLSFIVWVEFFVLEIFVNKQKPSFERLMNARAFLFPSLFLFHFRCEFFKPILSTTLHNRSSNFGLSQSLASCCGSISPFSMWQPKRFLNFSWSTCCTFFLCVYFACPSGPRWFASTAIENRVIGIGKKN